MPSYRRTTSVSAASHSLLNRVVGSLLLCITFAVEAHAQQTLRIEISGVASERERIHGQLVDLPVLIHPETRPAASESELLDGEAELCVFVRFNSSGETTELRLGLIDRRANRRLVERRMLQDDERSVAVELAALTVRQWVSDLLRGGELGVAVSPQAVEVEVEVETAAEATSPAPEPMETSAQPEPSLDPIGLHAEAGWLTSIDGSPRITHGPTFALGFGQRHWTSLLVSAFSLGNQWNVGRATIERSHLTLLWSVEGLAHFGAWSVGGGVRTGPAWSWRRTLSVHDGLQPAAEGSTFSWVVAATGALTASVGPVLLSMRLGAEVWLRRPSYRIGSETTSPWTLRPVASLTVGYRWRRVSPSNPPSPLTAFAPAPPLYW